MKWKIGGQGLLAAAACTGLGLSLASCGQSNTVDYLYSLSTTNAPGQVNVYRVDSQSGALTQILDSPYSSGGNNPVGAVATPTGSTHTNAADAAGCTSSGSSSSSSSDTCNTAQYLYVINHDDNTLVQFAIGTDAKLYPEHTYNTPGTDPTAIAINPNGTFLYVVDTYQPGFTADNPGPGALVVYPINTDGSLGTPVPQTVGSVTNNYYPLGTSPAAVSSLANGNALYVADLLQAGESGTGASSCGAGQGAVRGFAISSAGVLAPTTGSPYCAGVTPSSITSHPLSTYVYATDSSENQIIGYQANSTTGVLTPFTSAPIATGVAPASVTVEPRGLYMYVANRGSNNVEAYTIAGGTGYPTTLGTYATLGAYPQCILVEPALARFVYTSDFEGVGLTGFQLNPNTGVLTGTENSPYVGNGLQTCAAAVIHGNHPTVSIQNTAG